MNNWHSVYNASLEDIGWHLWERIDSVYGVVYQTSTRDDLTPKGRAGFMSIDLLMATKQHTTH